MDMIPPGREASQVEEQVTQARRLHAAFASVFGHPSRRSTDQKLVMAHFRKVGSADEPIFKADKNGAFDPLGAALRDGARSMVLIIERQLKLERDGVNKKAKPKAKR